MPAARKSTAKPKTIDDYLAPLAADKRAALQKLEEVISYSLPAFRLDGRVIIWIGAGAEHCAIYGPNPGLDDELSKYDVSKGTIRFQPDRPLPDSLVRKIVKARVARNASRAKPAKKPKR
jgi:uncharacterized protein YdhG (YjbR/CyaY superfamily)